MTGARWSDGWTDGEWTSGPVNEWTCCWVGVTCAAIAGGPWDINELNNIINER